MSTLQRATHNTLLLLAGQLITWGSTLALAAVYGRYLGPAPFGELYLATTFTALIGFPIEYSFNQQVVRDVAQAPERAHHYLTATLALKGLLWVGLYGVSLLLTVALGYSLEQRGLIALCGLMLVSTAISTTLISIQTAYMRVGMAKFGTVIEKGLDVILATLLLRAGAGVQVVAVVLLLGSVAGMAWQLVRVARMIGLHFVWDAAIARTLTRSGVSFLAYGVLGVIYYRIDTVLLSVLGTAAAVGVYGAAYRLLDTLMFIPSIIMGAVMSPMLAQYSLHNQNKLRLAIEKSTTAMLLCSVPATLGLMVTAPNVISFIYGQHGFRESAVVLQGLAFGIVALYLNSVLTTVLISTGQERKLPLMAAVALVFNVAINLVLIPRFMGSGAAWATSLTEVLLLGVGMALVDRQLIPARLWSTGGKIALAGVVMAGVAHLLTGLPILLIIPPAAVTYGAMILALRVLPAEDVALLRQVVERRLAGRLPDRLSAYLSGRISTYLSAHIPAHLFARISARIPARNLFDRWRARSVVGNEATLVPWGVDMEGESA
jgi:O-antigen/teichoic acid export membrane protein